ncbi:MAG: hypothetical protein AVDCRST_MAG69-502 [uncultured Solirubrobacteraceae bacterium]|uniref:Uncharacterized protein n=1 Tax=uncultured Solirubrobacteraceae bacterium TaxID=1162706 RepID=A0A6J4RM80_9ACTN|nr:MAG: hypothetical protein AVDCRST_MAG69-502 [uncultured Solirubrobacteraceae bacterium]
MPTDIADERLARVECPGAVQSGDCGAPVAGLRIEQGELEVGEPAVWLALDRLAQRPPALLEAVQATGQDAAQQERVGAEPVEVRGRRELVQGRLRVRRAVAEGVALEAGRRGGQHQRRPGGEHQDAHRHPRARAEPPPRWPPDDVAERAPPLVVLPALRPRSQRQRQQGQAEHRQRRELPEPVDHALQVPGGEPGEGGHHRAPSTAVVDAQRPDEPPDQRDGEGQQQQAADRPQLREHPEGEAVRVPGRLAAAPLDEVRDAEALRADPTHGVVGEDGERGAVEVVAARAQRAGEAAAVRRVDLLVAGRAEVLPAFVDRGRRRADRDHGGDGDDRREPQEQPVARDPGALGGGGAAPAQEARAEAGDGSGGERDRAGDGDRPDGLGQPDVQLRGRIGRADRHQRVPAEREEEHRGAHGHEGGPAPGVQEQEDDPGRREGERPAASLRQQRRAEQEGGAGERRRTEGPVDLAGDRHMARRPEPEDQQVRRGVGVLGRLREPPTEEERRGVVAERADQERPARDERRAGRDEAEGQQRVLGMPRPEGDDREREPQQEALVRALPGVARQDRPGQRRERPQDEQAERDDRERPRAAQARRRRRRQEQDDGGERQQEQRRRVPHRLAVAAVERRERQPRQHDDEPRDQERRAVVDGAALTAADADDGVLRGVRRRCCDLPHHRQPTRARGRRAFAPPPDALPDARRCVLQKAT